MTKFKSDKNHTIYIEKLNIFVKFGFFGEYQTDNQEIIDILKSVKKVKIVSDEKIEVKKQENKEEIEKKEDIKVKKIEVKKTTLKTKKK